MAQASFDITPREITAASNNVEGVLRDFNRSYTNIYSATGDLRVQFQGQASSTFNERIEGYRSDFLAVERTVQQFIEFLRAYSQEASRKEQDLTGRAGQLSTGARS